MKISGQQVNRVMQVYQQRQQVNKTKQVNDAQRAPGKRAAEPETTTGGDNVILSRRAQEMRLARKEFEKLPDLRSDLVEDLRARVNSGEYRIDGDRIAERILKRSIVDRLV